MLDHAKNTRTLLIAVTCGWLISSSSARAENWPQWRGPQGTGVSHEQNLALNWSEQQGLAWKVDLPEWGTSTPTIWKDAIFLTSQRDDRLLLLRLDVKDGHVAWTRELGKSSVDRMPLRKKEGSEREKQRFHELQNMASPSPVTDGDVV